MPCNWENSNSSETILNLPSSFGWTFGNSNQLSGPYWAIPEFGNFAVSNDDLCNCDMFQDRLISPPFDLTEEEGLLSLQFDSYYNGSYGSMAYVDVSLDSGNTWTEVLSISPNNNWQGININLSSFIGNSFFQFAFRHSDNHSWGSGFARQRFA